MIGATKYITPEASVSHWCQVPLIFIEDSSISPMHCSEHFVQCSMQFLRRCSMHFYAQQQISAWISAMTCGRLLCLLLAFRATDVQEANYDSTWLTHVDDILHMQGSLHPSCQTVSAVDFPVLWFRPSFAVNSPLTWFEGVLAPQPVISNHYADEMAKF